MPTHRFQLLIAVRQRGLVPGGIQRLGAGPAWTPEHVRHDEEVYRPPAE